MGLSRPFSPRFSKVSEVGGIIKWVDWKWERKEFRGNISKIATSTPVIPERDYNIPSGVTHLWREHIWICRVELGQGPCSVHDKRLLLHTSAVGTSGKTSGTRHTLVDASTMPRGEIRGPCESPSVLWEGAWLWGE